MTDTRMQLASGQTAMIDSDTLPLIEGHKWLLELPHDERHCARVVRYDDSGSISLARVITNASPDQVVLYANDDPLDLRRRNLVVTDVRGARISQTKRNRHGYRGVCYCRERDKYFAKITSVDGRRMRSVRVDSPYQAALLYDELARQHHGALARLNFPMAGERPAQIARAENAT